MLSFFFFLFYWEYFFEQWIFHVLLALFSLKGGQWHKVSIIFTIWGHIVIFWESCKTILISLYLKYVSVIYQKHIKLNVDSKFYKVKILTHLLNLIVFLFKEGESFAWVIKLWLHHRIFFSKLHKPLLRFHKMTILLNFGWNGISPLRFV